MAYGRGGRGSLPAAETTSDRRTVAKAERDLESLPGQLNLELGAVVVDLEFHLQIDLGRHVRDKSQVLPLDHLCGLWLA